MNKELDFLENFWKFFQDGTKSINDFRVNVTETLVKSGQISEEALEEFIKRQISKEKIDGFKKQIAELEAKIESEELKTNVRLSQIDYDPCGHSSSFHSPC